MKSLEETVNEQGGEEFLAMVKEVMMGLLHDIELFLFSIAGKGYI